MQRDISTGQSYPGIRLSSSALGILDQNILTRNSPFANSNTALKRLARASVVCNQKFEERLAGGSDVESVRGAQGRECWCGHACRI